MKYERYRVRLGLSKKIKFFSITYVEDKNLFKQPQSGNKIITVPEF